MNDQLNKNYNILAQNKSIIDDTILNTPPEEEFDPQKVVGPENAIKTYFDMQKNKTNPQGGDVILDLDGKKTPVNTTEEFNTQYQDVKNVLGSDSSQSASSINAATILVVIAIILGVFIFVVMNLRRSDYILKLEDEIEKLKENKKYY